MERRRFRYLAPLALLIVVLGLVYRSNSALAEQAPSLIADSWNSAFYSAVPAADQMSSAEMPPIGYPDDVLSISGGGKTGTTVSGLPGSIILMTGYPNPTVPLSGGTGPTGVVSGFPYPPISITGNPIAVTGFPKPPISVTGNPASTCRRPLSITAVGFPYGPVTIKWTAVAGATSYWVAIGAIPPQKNYYVLLAYTNVAAPTLQATIPLNHAEAQAVVQKGSPYVVLVQPKGSKLTNDCISTKQYSTAIRKPVVPATKPAVQPATPPVVQSDNPQITPTLILPTAIITVTPGPKTTVAPCPSGTTGSPANGQPCQPIKIATQPPTQPPAQPTSCPRGTVVNPLGPGCTPVRKVETPCPSGTQGNPGGPCIDIPK